MSVTIRDLFCGAGGSSTGAAFAGAEVKHALNHWTRAIETHATNFPDADHSCADIASLTTNQIRRFDPTDILWASPECTNHSLAKGARRRPPQTPSLWEDGPAGDAEQDRSRATMWDVPRFCEQAQLKGHSYKAVIVENVVDVVKWGSADDGGLFNAWLTAMNALGYLHETVFLNSMTCWPTPQSRDRVYVVFWLKTLRRPNLRFEPQCWCPGCELIVAGRQTWKRPTGDPKLGRLWGRYGPQYFYTCATCHGPALPAVFPAASIIDWDLAAQRIGDRDRPLADNTRARIKRGLERLAHEPFAIKLTHGGAPRPLSLPVVTLIARHDAAMVMPVAGNTFERTAGNRARDAHLVPLDTVHTTLDRAMVVPPMGSVDPRPAHTEPAPTQTTTTRSAVVIPQRRHTLATDAAAAATPTVAAGGGHLAMVMRNNESRGDRGAMCTPTDAEPIRTLTTSGHQSLVMANTQNGVPRPAHEQPAQTLRTEDGLAMVTTYNSGEDNRCAELEPTSTLTTRDRLAIVVPAGGGWAEAATARELVLRVLEILG